MYIASGEYSQAEEIFNQIKEPTVQNYVGLMQVFNQSKNYERVFQLYEQFKAQRKIQANAEIYLALLTAIKESQQYERVKQIEEDLLKQNHSDIKNLLKEIRQ